MTTYPISLNTTNTVAVWLLTNQNEQHHHKKTKHQQIQQHCSIRKEMFNHQQPVLVIRIGHQILALDTLFYLRGIRQRHYKQCVDAQLFLCISQDQTTTLQLLPACSKTYQQLEDILEQSCGNSIKLRELLGDEPYQHVNIAFVAYSSDIDHQTTTTTKSSNKHSNNPLFHTIDVEHDGCIVYGPFEHVSTTFTPACEDDKELFDGNKVCRILA
jgi:hypothetical protein